MARVKLSGLISDIRGGVGGSYFQQSQGGLVLKNKSGKLKTSSLVKNRSNVLNNIVQQELRALTQLEITLWYIYSSGASQWAVAANLVGTNWKRLFRHYNGIRLRQGLPIMKAPPFTGTLPIAHDIQIQRSGTDLFVQMVPALQANESLSVHLSHPVGSSIESVGSRLRSMVGIPVNSTTIEVSETFVQNFGRLPESGEKIFAKWRSFSTNVPVTGNLFQMSKTVI